MPTASLAEAKTHPVDLDAFLKHHRQIAEAKREHEDTSTALARAKKAAKTGAVDLEAYKFIEKLRKLEEEEQGILLRHIVQYAGYLEMPIGTQFSLIDAPRTSAPAKPSAASEHALWEAGERGLKAGRDGEQGSVNPFPLGSALHVSFERKYRDGLTERATAARMADTDDERPADVAEATRRGARKPRSQSAKVRDVLDNARLHLNGGGPSTH